VLTVLLILFYLLLVYVFLISIRLVLGWFAPRALGRAWDFITAATDPYLNFFRRIRFLSGGFPAPDRPRVDFSPLAALLVLVVAITLLNRLLSYGRITLGFFLASVLSAAWWGVACLLIFLLIAGVLRTIPLGFRGVSGSPLWRVADMIIQPAVNWVMRVFRLGARTGYTQHLLLTVGLLLVTLIFGHYIVWGFYGFVGIERLLESIPI